MVDNESQEPIVQIAGDHNVSKPIAPLASHNVPPQACFTTLGLIRWSFPFSAQRMRVTVSATICVNRLCVRFTGPHGVHIRGRFFFQSAQLRGNADDDRNDLTVNQVTSKLLLDTMAERLDSFFEWHSQVSHQTSVAHLINKWNRFNSRRWVNRASQLAAILPMGVCVLSTRVPFVAGMYYLLTRFEC
jgi:hypothetical protein